MDKIEITTNTTTSAVTSVGISLLLFAWSSMVPMRLHDISAAPSVSLFSYEDPFNLAAVRRVKSRPEQALRVFALNLLANTVDMPREFGELINKHFWEMYEPI